MSDPMHVPCDHVIARLWEFLDGEVEGGSAERIGQHLDACARCFPEYDFRGAYLRFMRRCAEQQIPQELRSRVFRMILEEELKGEAGRCARP